MSRPPIAGVDLAAIRDAAAAQGGRVTTGIEDMAEYLASQVDDASHRDVIGPLLPASGASGVVTYRGEMVASWGDPSIPEMCFSATKGVVSAVAELAADAGLLADVHAPVADTIDLPSLAPGTRPNITWHHLLQQTSGWDGELWGKPARADAQGGSSDTTAAIPGWHWAYNDVRVNLLCRALTVLWRRPLPVVLRERLLDPLGASPDWSWHGYGNAVVHVDGERLPVVSGGAHWGGGLWMSALDLALLGQLYLRRGRWGDRHLLSQAWIGRTWTPCPVNADYGYLWWLNDGRRVLPAAPPSGRAARGNKGQHLLWVDPTRELVIGSHWGDGVEALLAAVSAAIPRVDVDGDDATGC